MKHKLNLYIFTTVSIAIAVCLTEWGISNRAVAGETSNRSQILRLKRKIEVTEDKIRKKSKLGLELVELTLDLQTLYMKDNDYASTHKLWEDSRKFHENLYGSGSWEVASDIRSDAYVFEKEKKI